MAATPFRGNSSFSRESPSFGVPMLARTLQMEDRLREEMRQIKQRLAKDNIRVDSKVLERSILIPTDPADSISQRGSKMYP